MKISKSLSLKVNLGNYQVADFFVSAEAECDYKDKDSQEVSQNLHDFCREQITKDVNNSKKYLQDLANGKVNDIKLFPTDEMLSGDSATDFLGEWNVPEPKRNDKKV